MPTPLSAVRWILFGSFGFRLISLAGQMIILRVVDKDAFGAYRAVVLIHLMCLVLLPLSLDTLVIREKLRQSRYVAALSQVLALIACVLAATAAVGSLFPGTGAESWLGRALDLEPHHAALLLFTPALFFVQAAKLVVRAVLTSTLHFRTISLGEFGNGLLTWLGGAALVLIYPQAWVLMLAFFVGELFEFIYMQRRHPFQPAKVLRPRRWSIGWKVVRRHLRYTIFNTSNLTVGTVASMLPGVLFAALISKEATAEFTVALQLLVLPTMLLSGALWRVAFPSISGVPEAELQRRCLSITAASSAYIAPTVLWFAFFAPTTIWILAGDAYLEATTPIVRWLALYMVLVAVYTPISSLDMVRDLPEVGLAYNLAYVAGRIAVIFYFADDGLLAVVAAMSVFSLGMWVAHTYIYGLLLRAPWKRFLAAPGRFVPLWGVLALGFWGCLWVTDGHLIWAPALSVLPALAYLALIVRFFPAEGSLVRRFLKRHAA